MSLVYSETVGGKRHGVYLGGKADAKSRQQLERWGVTHVLNVTPPKEGSIQAGVPNYFEKNFRYKRVAVYDASTSNLLQYANDVVAFISSGLCHGSVLVHCQRGVSRSATCVAFYLMRKAGMSLEDSMALIRQKRPEAKPIPAFTMQLLEYEQTCIDLGVISKTSKRKLEDSDGASKKKRAAIGPAMGPPKRVMGPSLPQTEKAGGRKATMPATKEKKHETKAVCGPQLPGADEIAKVGNEDEDEGKP